jgi:hypothetical protein
MSLVKIEALIEALGHERDRWMPMRRVYREKPPAKQKRPLGVPTWSNQLVHAVLRLILEAYYEPQCAAVCRLLVWVSARTWVPHRLARQLPDRDRNAVVHCGR